MIDRIGWTLPAAEGVTRRMLDGVRVWLAGHGVPPAPESAVLEVLRELVANAVQHSLQPRVSISLVLSTEEREVFVYVQDGDCDTERVHWPQDDCDPAAGGLQRVRRLATRFGVQEVVDPATSNVAGKGVWATIALDARIGAPPAHAP